jgi:SAM-dependent methyltransferase
MRSFYESNLALIHNAGFGALARGAGRVLLDRLRQSGAPAGTLVDLGCGSGALAEQVSAAGYEVVGVDLSPHLLSLARQRVPQAQFILASLYDVELPEAAAITMIGECVNYVVDGGLTRRTCRRCSNASSLSCGRAASSCSMRPRPDASRRGRRRRLRRLRSGAC